MCSKNDSAVPLSVVVTVVSGRQSLAVCLESLVPQCEHCGGEIIVPYDDRCMNVVELATDFPSVRFPFVEDSGLWGSANAPTFEHRLYDRRRAVGLSVARGSIIAMTEDHAVPARDWCEKILEAHRKSVAVLGGAIENQVDCPLNWAWYYCDFGRYGRPFASCNADFVSDVNVSYKRDAILSVQDIWSEAYCETTVHWELARRGETIVLDPLPVVYQNRPSMSFGSAMKERAQWGRVFAESRAERLGHVRRLLFAAGTAVLPLLLTLRVIRNMCRQRRSVGQLLQVVPLAFILLLSWAWGEFLGYLLPPAKRSVITGRSEQSVAQPASRHSANATARNSHGEGACRSLTGTIPILTYHSIDSSGSVVSVSPEDFEDQVACIAELGFRCVSLQQALTDHKGNGSWPAQTVVMTFDDALLNVYERALPVLQRFGFTATVYVITDFVGTSNQWESPPGGLGRQQTMEWDQLHSLVEAGWEIGAHTRTHPSLRLLGEDELKNEISGSRSHLEQRLGIHVTSFAYPYGLVDDRSQTIVRAQYESACTTRLRRAGDDALHQLPRVDTFYLRNRTMMRRLLLGQLDGYLTLRRWGRWIRHLGREKKSTVYT